MEAHSVKALIRRAYASWRRSPIGDPGDLLPDVPLQPTIARAIHQIYTGGSVPEDLQANIARMRAANPGWDFRLYDERSMPEYIRDHYGPRVLEYYLKINPRYGAARADLFRYLLIYRLGGIYLDVKSSITKPLSATLRPGDQYLLSRWHNQPGESDQGKGLHRELAGIPGGEFQQWHIAAAAGHPFLRAVIAQVLANVALYNPLVHGTGANVLHITGPIAYTLAIAPLLSCAPHRVVDAEHDLGFVFSIYGSSTKHRGLFGPHYSRLAEPIVHTAPISSLVHALSIPAILGKRWVNEKLRQSAARES